jgi:hypothetical protein
MLNEMKARILNVSHVTMTTQCDYLFSSTWCGKEHRTGHSK